jgi:ABC-type phosphate/phosphonate transport system substrate-binding protein
LQEQGLSAEAGSNILDLEGLISAFRNDRADCAAMTTDEYFILNQKVKASNIFVGDLGGGIFEEYLLLVQQDGKVKDLSDLKGLRIILYANARMSLARPWLDLILARRSLPRAEAFFGAMLQKPKPANVLLPVFFNAADACLVTRRVFNTMAELNPQVGRKLRILATSPQVVPSLFCFNAACKPIRKEIILRAITNLHKSPAGQQILTIYQLGKLEEQPETCLNSARELLNERSRIWGR